MDKLKNPQYKQKIKYVFISEIKSNRQNKIFHL